jgi:hypothetical protein
MKSSGIGCGLGVYTQSMTCSSSSFSELTFVVVPSVLEREGRGDAASMVAKGGPAASSAEFRSKFFLPPPAASTLTACPRTVSAQPQSKLWVASTVSMYAQGITTVLPSELLA